MNRLEFSKIMNYIATMIGKPIAANEREAEARMNGYWELLKDIPLGVLQAAAKKVVLEHKWATFPTVAEIRDIATTIGTGRIQDVSPAEAWLLASQAITKIDPEIRGPYRMRGRNGQMEEFPTQAEAVLSKLPSVVVKTIRAYGLHAICYGQEPIGVVRGQFLKMFEQIAEVEKKRSLVPEALKREIEAKSPAALGNVAQNALSQIGIEPTTEKFHG